MNEPTDYLGAAGLLTTLTGLIATLYVVGWGSESQLWATLALTALGIITLLIRSENG